MRFSGVIQLGSVLTVIVLILIGFAGLEIYTTILHEIEASRDYQRSNRKAIERISAEMEEYRQHSAAEQRKAMREIGRLSGEIAALRNAVPADGAR